MVWLMVIDDFDLMRVPVLPDKANAPLVIDADTVLACPTAFESFEAIARRHPQIFQVRRCRELGQLPKGSALNAGGKTPRACALPNLFRLLAVKILNHFLIL